MVGDLCIGLVYETFDSYEPAAAAPADWAVEYEPASTVAAIERAFASLGVQTRRLGTPHALLEELQGSDSLGVGAVLSIAEGFGSRNRESWVPVLLEMKGIQRLGSDGLTLSVSLDKAWAKHLVAAAGVPVAPHCVVASAAALAAAELPAFPLFVKPRWEGTSKGIRESSRVGSLEALAREVDRIVRDYQQPALVESFLPGAEYTVTIVGHDPARALPVLQRALEVDSRIGLHALEHAHTGALAHCVPGDLSSALEKELQRLGRLAFEALECLDYARADFRLDEQGWPYFLEINPLPTFADDSSFAILAELEGRAHHELLADVFADALRRLGLYA